MATTLAFGAGSEITGLPDGNSVGQPAQPPTVYVPDNPLAPYTFSPFSAAAVISSEASVTFLVAIGSPLATRTLYAVDPVFGTTTSITSDSIKYVGSPTDAQAWLQSIYIIDTAQAVAPDSFPLHIWAYGATSLNAGGEFMRFTVACFLEGTQIATPSGMASVEALAIGDQVLTANGVVRPVKWVGHRHHCAADVQAHPNLRPVLVARDAVAPGIPARDLRVSGEHGLQIDGLIIPAAALVNDSSVRRDDSTAPVTYYHIELADHDLVLAEGLAAETFVNVAGRALFDNGAEYDALYGATAAEVTFQTNRVEEGYQLEAARKMLAGRSLTPVTAPGRLIGQLERLDDGILEGWVTDTDNAHQPVELEVLIDGAPVARLLANRYRTDLDNAGLAGGRCGFTVALQEAATSLGQIRLRRVSDHAMLAGMLTLTA